MPSELIVALTATLAAGLAGVSYLLSNLRNGSRRHPRKNKSRTGTSVLMMQADTDEMSSRFAAVLAEEQAARNAVVSSRLADAVAADTPVRWIRNTSLTSVIIYFADGTTICVSGTDRRDVRELLRRLNGGDVILSTFITQPDNARLTFQTPTGPCTVRGALAGLAQPD